MTGQEMIDFARTISGGLSTSQLPTATAIKYANIGYHKVKREIINLKEDFFWDILKVDDTVVNQNEYTIPAGLTGNYKDVSKTMAVSIKYSDTTDYIKCDKQYQYQLTEDLDYYKTTQGQTNPFFFIADNSYFIFPTPTVAVSEGIKIYGIKNLIDITESTTEVNIFDGKIPTEYHYIVPLYIRYMYYMSRGVDFKQDTISAKADFDIALQEITDGLGQRDMSIIYKKKP